MPKDRSPITTISPARRWGPRQKRLTTNERIDAIGRVGETDIDAIVQLEIVGGLPYAKMS